MRRGQHRSRAPRKIIGGSLLKLKTRYEMIDALEPRYLLTQVFTGTSGNDTITISLGTSNQQQVKINSTLYQPTDDDFEVDALGGDDTIKITGISPGLASNNNVTVDSGAGNDTITASVEGGVTLTIDNSDPTSTDTLTIDDSGNSSSNVEDTRIETSNGNPEFHQELTGLDGLLYYENINAVTYKGSVFGETIYVDAPISGVTLDLGNAANTIDYDGDDDVLFGTVAPMTINGGTGTDKVIFDDASGTGTTQTYAFTPTTALNQTLSGIDSIELDARTISGQFNTITMTGNPSNGPIIIDGGPSIMSIGWAAAPLDFDSLTFHLTINADVEMSLFDQDADGSDNGWFIATDNSPAQQELFKGVSSIIWGASSQVILDLQAGSTADAFNIAGTVSDSSITINGGAGNDTLLGSNYTGTNNIPDRNVGKLAAIFAAGSFFEFDGGDGTDQLILDDDASTGDGKPDYFVGSAWFAKSATAGFNPSALLFYDSTTEDINLLGDGDNNNITFAEGPTQSATLNGGSGNDTMLSGTTNGESLANSGTASIVGGAGTDSLAIDDEINTVVSEYDFDTGAFSYAIGAGTPHTISYDSTLENMTLNENDAATTTNLRGKPSTLNLIVLGEAGNDTFVIGGGDLDSNGWTHTTLDGGGGTDSIEFDDHLDTYSSTETENYTMTSGLLTKGSVSITYTTFESQQLDASTVGADNIQFDEVVNLNSANVSTTIVGGTNRLCIVAIGNGDLSNVGFVSLNFGSTGEAVVNDQSSTGDKTYDLDANILTVSSGQIVEFNTGALTLDTNDGDDTINVLGSGAGEPDTINAGSGNDTITVGQGVLTSNFAVVPTIDGGAGTNALIFDNHADPAVETLTLTATGLAVGSLTFPLPTDIASITIETGTGGGAVNLESVPVNITVTGGSGNDNINIGSGNLATTLNGAVVINGGGGTNNVMISDAANSGGSSYTFSGGLLKCGTSFVFESINASNIAGETLTSGSGNDVVSITNVTYALTVNTGAGNDQITTVSSTNVSFNTGSETASLMGPPGDEVVVGNGSTVATMKLNGTDTVALLTTNAGGKLQVPQILIASHGIGSGDLTNNGVIDLDGGALIVDGDSSKLSVYAAWIKAGYRNGSWTGIGTTIDKVPTGAINSSLAAQDPTDDAVGYAPASAIFSTFPATFVGQSVTSTAMLVRYTEVGDANLDGKVNAQDFDALAANYGATGVNWYQGDFNYDGKVDVTDFNALAAHFNKSITAAPPLESSPLSDSVALPQANVFSTSLVQTDSSGDDLLKSDDSVL